MTKWKLSKSRSEREDDGVNGGDGREVGIDRREVNLPIRRMFGCKRRALRQEWYPHHRRGDKRKRGTSPFPVRREDWGDKTAPHIRGGIKMGDGKRELGFFVELASGSKSQIIMKRGICQS